MEFITKDSDIPNNTIILDLINNDNGTVSLMATHAVTGQSKWIMTFRDGKACRTRLAILPGIESDKDGYIIVD